MVQINARKVRRIYHGEKKVYENNIQDFIPLIPNRNIISTSTMGILVDNSGSFGNLIGEITFVKLIDFKDMPVLGSFDKNNLSGSCDIYKSTEANTGIANAHLKISNKNLVLDETQSGAILAKTYHIEGMPKITIS